MTPLLQLQGLEVRYGAVDAVRGIDIAIEKGEIVALLGANGAGKSSTMNAIAGLAPVAGGRILFDEDDITDRPAEAMPGLGLTLAPEGRRVFGTLSVQDNLAMAPMRQAGKAPSTRPMSGCSHSSRFWPNAASSLRARCPAVSSRCSRSAGR